MSKQVSRTLYALLSLWTVVIQAGYASADKPTVVATASMIADMASQIAGDKLDIKCIVPIGGDPHVYEATPGDAQLVAGADLILKNGLTFEGWLNELISNAGSEAAIATVTEGITPIQSLVYKNATDPHAWMDARNGLQYIDNIRKALILLDPANKLTYEQNHAAYRQRLLEADAYIEQKILTIPPEKRILITSHDAFQYYGKRYGLRLESVMGVSTDADIQTSDIVRLNQIIDDSKVPAVFIESTINPKVLQQIARDNGVKIGGKLYADSIGDEDSPAPGYIEMLKHNTDVIAGALTLQDPIAEDLNEEHGTNKLPVYIGLVVILIFLFIFLALRFNR